MFDRDSFQNQFAISSSMILNYRITGRVQLIVIVKIYCNSLHVMLTWIFPSQCCKSMKMFIRHKPHIYHSFRKCCKICRYQSIDILVLPEPFSHFQWFCNSVKSYGSVVTRYWMMIEEKDLFYFMDADRKWFPQTSCLVYCLLIFSEICCIDISPGGFLMFTMSILSTR